MNTEEVFDKVKEIIVEQLGVTENTVTLEASFIDDLGADSLDIVELIMALEEEFDMEIPDADAEKIVTVNDVLRTINKEWSSKYGGYFFMYFYLDQTISLIYNFN